MAATLWMVRPDSVSEQSVEAVAEHVDSTQIAEAMRRSYIQARREELAEADRDYLQTIAELREMLEEDREAWSAQEVAAVDAQLSSFRKAAIGSRFAIESESYVVQTRDTLYANYRSEIGFLQSALAGDLPGGGR